MSLGTEPKLVVRPADIRIPEASVDAFRAMTETDILKAWEKQIDFSDIETRDAVLQVMRERDIYPSKSMREYETSTGLYPDVFDPDFARRLYSKTEFAELKSGAVSEDVCAAKDDAFDTTSVQRLVARFLHPYTPYRGLLLDHGVGVGKTCSAITVAEMFLEMLPANKVTILCPQAIATGFRRTIFDADRLVQLPARLAQLRGESWESNQCTGMTYPRLTGNASEGDREAIERDIEQIIRKRYRIMGYLQFANWVLKKLAEVPKSIQGSAREEAENRILHGLFSDHLVVIDEAHNLRDIEGAAAAAAAAVAATVSAEGIMAKESPVAGAATDAAEGKKLTPILRRILRVSEGLRLMLMTATPMYNTAPEILFLLNILLLNDMKDENKLLKPRDFFAADGSLLPTAHEPLRKVCGRYISYMRGENPASFPLRLTPPEVAGARLFEDYPEKSISRREGTVQWTTQVRRIMSMLSLVIHTPDIRRTAVGRVLYKLLGAARGELDPTTADEGSEVSDFVLDQATQIANITYPDGSFGSRGWDTYWREMPGRLRQFKWAAPTDEEEDWTPTVDDVFGEKGLAGHSPKAAAIVRSLQGARGICFVFSRYVKAGALPVAIALERAGWTRVLADGTAFPLMRDAPPVARACAFCNVREGGAHQGHTFAAANFVLLTGDDGLTVDFKGTLRYATTLKSESDVRGGRVKAIIGSQITSEGLDLKCIRENHIMDGWYHLNRIEQVVGRAVRYCSHAALPKEEQNCLIYMHAVKIPEYETADLYAYRLACRKSIPIGQVQRIIKVSAWDCLMNKEAVDLQGLPRRRVMDAQGRVIARYNPNDAPYTSICDFQDACEYACAVSERPLEANDTTYRAEDARRRFLQKQRLVREFFRDEVAISIPQLKLIYSDVPWDIASVGIRDMLDNPRFVVERADGTRGTLHFQHGYVVFQPLGITDTDIPMALRFGRAYGRLSRYMEIPRGALLEAERPMGPVPVVEEAAPGAAPAVPAANLAHTAAQKSQGELFEDAVRSLAEWKTHVVDRIYTTPMKTDIVPPAGLPAGPYYKAWRWVFKHFQTIEGTTQIASQWWMDTQWTLGHREAILRKLVRDGVQSDEEREMVRRFQPAEFFRGAISGYQVVAVGVASGLKTYCFFEGDADIAECPSNLIEDVRAIIGPAVDRVKDTGPLFGVQIYDKTSDTVILKTLNKDDDSWKDKGSLKGLQCSNTSNLDGPRARITAIQAQIRTLVGDDHPILELLIDDNANTQPSADLKKKHKNESIITHLYEMQQKHVCAYMEFLLRWMDYHNSGGKRWFLSVVDSLRAGWKIKK